MLVGDDGMERLAKAKVGVFGLGGVGSYAVEALARAGVGHLFLLDFDKVDPTNINRQLIALTTTVGQMKVDVARARVLDINPNLDVETCSTFLRIMNVDTVVPGDLDFAIDAIDALGPKANLLLTLHKRGVPYVACMGASSRISPANVRIGDLADVRNCPLAKRVRQRLRKHGIERGVRCVYSDELPQQRFEPDPADAQTRLTGEPKTRSRLVRGTISYLPGLVGLTAAGVIINDILAR